MNGKCAVPIDRLQLYGRKRFISEMYLNCVLKLRVISQFRSKRIRRKASWAKDKEIFFSFFLSFQHIWKPVILIVMKSKFFHLNLNLFRTNLFYFHFSEVSRRHSEFMFRLLFCMECVWWAHTQFNSPYHPRLFTSVKRSRMQTEHTFGFFFRLLFNHQIYNRNIVCNT